MIGLEPLQPNENTKVNVKENMKVNTKENVRGGGGEVG